MKEFKNVSVSVNYDDRNRIVKMIFKGFALTKDYREAWDMALSVAVKNKCDSWFIDQRDFKGASPEDLKWAVESWMPKSIDELKKVGLAQQRKVAVILSSNIFAEVSTKKSIATAAQKTEKAEFVYFEAAEPALKYLTSAHYEIR